MWAITATINGTVRPEPVEGQSRTVPYEARLKQKALRSVRNGTALHFDKLSANGSLWQEARS